MGMGLVYGDKFNDAQTKPRLATSGDLTLKGDLYPRGIKLTGDRTAKDGFADVKSREILKHLVLMPIQSWNYKDDPNKIRHIGPMAQGFHAAFGFDDDDKHIAVVDANGVAFAAIQGLNQIVEEQASELAVKERRINALEQRLSQIERLLSLKAVDAKESDGK